MEIQAIVSIGAAVVSMVAAVAAVASAVIARKSLKQQKETDERLLALQKESLDHQKWQDAYNNLQNAKQRLDSIASRH